MAKTDLLIGVDGGATRCRVAIRRATAPDVLALVEGGAANVTTDFDGSIRAIRSALAEAASQAGLPPDAVASSTAHLGLAGILDADGASRVASTLGLARCAVTDDRHIQVIGALGGDDGYVVAVGTGTIVARARNGEVRGVGGWGFTLSDQGSGADMGRAALRRAILCADGLADHSPLTRSCLAAHGGCAGLAVFAAEARPGAYAGLAPEIIAAADAGDPHGLAILREGAEYIDGALAALGFERGDVLCLAGGVGPWYARHLDAARHGLRAPLGTALDGALSLAERAWREARPC